MDKWMEIRTLSGEGRGIRSIAKQLHISRNSVRKVLRGDISPPAKRQRIPFSKLLPFEDNVVKMVEEDRLIGTRILHELKKLGYTGGRSPLYRYLETLKKSLTHHCEKVTCRFETPPGFQFQFDWSPYRISLGGYLTRVVVYCLILAYCRRKFYWPSLNETQESTFEAIERGFAHFGGVAKEILVDNARSFVKDARPEHFEWNPRFRDFCKHYGIVPKACKVRRSQTKGKVERPFYFLEEHFIKGRSFLDFTDFARRLQDFSSELDYRIHQTLNVPPMEKFEEERETLSPLPAIMFFGASSLFRKVSWDCLISFDNSRYSVPYQFAGKEVSLKVSQGAKLEIYSSRGDLIASHTISLRKGSVVIDHMHYEGLRKQSPRTLVNLKRVFIEEFPDDTLFMEKLLAQYKWNSHHHLRAILELVPLYAKEHIREAFALALSYNTFSPQFIRGILEKKGEIKKESTNLSPMVSVPRFQFKRNLNEYNKLIKHEGGTQ